MCGLMSTAVVEFGISRYAVAAIQSTAITESMIFIGLSAKTFLVM